MALGFIKICLSVRLVLQHPSKPKLSIFGMLFMLRSIQTKLRPSLVNIIIYDKFELVKFAWRVMLKNRYIVFTCCWCIYSQEHNKIHPFWLLLLWIPSIGSTDFCVFFWKQCLIIGQSHVWQRILFLQIAVLLEWYHIIRLELIFE